MKAAELSVFAALIVLLNLHLLPGSSLAPLAFRTGDLETGEWWRLFTHPFVHVSWYHLLLDAGAFFILYAGLNEPRAWKRIAYLSASGAGSLLAAALGSPGMSSYGLCGLSGIAHGLMAVSALETVDETRGDRRLRSIGLLCFLAVVLKSLWEALSGQCVFSFLHFGMLGTPQAACHAGGVLGGVAAYHVHDFTSSSRVGNPIRTYELKHLPLSTKGD